MNILYKKDSKGKLRCLNVYADGNYLVQKSGLLDSDKPTIARKLCKGKNTGKSNETSPAEQAQKEAIALRVEKLRKGYFTTKEEAMEKGGSDFLSPMLAHCYEDHNNSIIFPCYVQPKLDGCRMLSSVENPFVSRTNKPFGTLDHIKLPKELIDTLDGEAYAHGLSFQENMKIIKKYVKGKTELVMYHVYDMVSQFPFAYRYAKLRELVEGCENIKLVPTYIANDLDDIKLYHESFIRDGYEGTIIRWGNEGYDVNKRSKYLLKYKDFIDETFEIVDVLPSDAQPTHGVVVCRSVLGNTFSCGMKLSHKEREEILSNKQDYIGKTGEVRFFEYTDGGIPRFPVYHGLRIDK
jgi:ATP-dependent DNA ligase